MEALADEVLAHESVSDKVKVKKCKTLRSCMSRLYESRAAVWDFVLEQWKDFARDSIYLVLRAMSEALDQDGYFVAGDERALVNVEELRQLLDMASLLAHPLVTDPDDKSNDSKTKFINAVKKYSVVAKAVADLTICVLCVKVEKIRVLCGNRAADASKLREWSVFDAASTKPKRICVVLSPSLLHFLCFLSSWRTYAKINARPQK